MIDPEVLILVLVEHTLGDELNFGRLSTSPVLILVLVEHTLGAHALHILVWWQRVLILVLVEHTLGDGKEKMVKLQPHSLNPCFSGTYSRRRASLDSACPLRSLNPCFSGTYSRRATFATNTISMHYALKNGT